MQHSPAYPEQCFILNTFKDLYSFGLHVEDTLAHPKNGNI